MPIPGLSNLWAETLGDPRVVVAVLDGPVDRSHPALVGARLKAAAAGAFVAPQVGGPATTHGTLVASLIFGQHSPSSPIRGMAPRCWGIVVPIFSDAASNGHELKEVSVPTCSQVDLARAISLAQERGAHVINVSGGQYGPPGRAHPILVKAVTRCVQRGVLIVAAAGNDGCECLHLPAALPGVLAVGAMDSRGEPLESSNWGYDYRSEGLLAPGEVEIRTAAGEIRPIESGTSFAAAVVSGAAALLLSIALARGQHLGGARIRQILLDSAEKCFDDSVSCRRRLAGRLDLVRAGFLLRTENPPMSDEGSQHTPPPAEAGTAAALGGEPPAGGMPHSAMHGTPLMPVQPIPGRSSGHSVVPSEGCGCAACRAKVVGPGGLVFALGQIGYDLVSEARRDSVRQHMGGIDPDPFDIRKMLDYLTRNPWDAPSLHWTLTFDQLPLYVVLPAGPYAGRAYELLREFLSDQMSGRVELVSIPGRLGGQVQLLNGQVVPVVIPELRGMYSWATGALVQKVVGDPPAAPATADQRTAYTRKVEAVRGFLDRIYHELRNLGLTAEERAANYAATNAFAVGQVFESALTESMELDTVEIERSPICRPDSDCWDVKIHFFYPAREVQTVRRVFRFTVDVSDAVPVTVGPMRTWFVR